MTIEWGYTTWNPWLGCEIAPGTAANDNERCYATRALRDLCIKESVPFFLKQWDTDARIASRIFLNSMSDLWEDEDGDDD
jgi:protein gp37